MNMKKLNVALAIFVAAVMAGHAATATSDVVFYQKISLPVGGKALAPTFIKGYVYRGLVSIAGSNVTFTGTPLQGLTLGPTTFTSVDNFPRYYAEVVSTDSPYCGYSFDIDSNTGSSVTSLNIPSGLTGSITIEIRPHVTLADLDPRSMNDGDSVNFVNDPSGNQFSFYVIGGDWYNGNFVPGYAHVPIYPGTGVIFTGQTSQVTITLIGKVKTTKTAVPVSVSAYGNIIAPVNPTTLVDLKGQGLTQSLNDGAAFTKYTTDGSFVEDSTFYTISGEVYDANFTPVAGAVNLPGGEAINVGALDGDRVIIIPGTQIAN
jgi:aspartate 1-decarboxylase